MGLLKLSRFFYDQPYEELTNEMIKAVKQSAIMNPTFHSYWLSVATKFSFPFYELGIVGDNYEKEREKIDRIVFTKYYSLWMEWEKVIWKF